MYDVILQKSVPLKIVYNRKKRQIFGLNMPFISSREARKCILYLWLCHSWNMHFLLHSIRPLDKNALEKIIFLFPNQNIQWDGSFEYPPSQWDGSFEHPKPMLKVMSKKIFPISCRKFLLIFTWARWNKCHIHSKNLKNLYKLAWNLLQREYFISHT